jgi:RNA polymerase sigma factor, sigma-70 family
MPSEPAHVSEEDLAQRVQQGDRSAFARLVEENVRRYFRIAYRILGDSGEAEEMVQNAFLKFWQEPQKWNFALGWKFSTWFYRVVVNLCLDRKRRQSRESSGDAPETAAFIGTAEDALLNREKQRMLHAWLQELPERQRTALQLCFYEGLSNEAAAEVMGLKLKALQSLLMRAKASLREKARLQ